MAIKGPVLIGSIIFALSLLTVAIAVIRPVFILPELTENVSYFEIGLIWISGLIGGLGIGYANRGGDGYGWSDESQLPVVIGGIGIAGIIVLAAWYLILKTVPDAIIAVGVLSGILSFVSCFLMTVAAGGDGY